MSIQEIRTKNAEQPITVTIDNESIPIDIQEIIKQSTCFIQEKSLDNVLYNPIDVKLFLLAFYNNTEENEINENNTEENEINENAEISEEIPPYVNELNNNPYGNYVPHGTVKITIRNAKTNYIHIQDKIAFRDGKIEKQFINNLNIGEYILTAEYEGNKYYSPTNINIYFTIAKRYVKCQFQQNNLTGYPNETISTNIHLTDSLSGKNINNILLYYSFNGNEYTTQTNNQGIATLNLTIPDIDPSKCSKEFIQDNETYDEENNIGEYYWDEDGNIQPISENEHIITINTEELSFAEEEETNTHYYAHMYPLDVYINNDTYIVENFTQ